MKTLRQAAEAVVNRWDAPQWRNQPSTARYMEDLRTALEAPEPEPEIKVLQAKCDAFLANTQMALDELEAMTAERDAYQRAADSMAMAHKIERDALLLANLDLKNWFDAIKSDYDALADAAKIALEALYCYETPIKKFGLLFGNGYNAITALKAAGVK